MNTRQSIVVRNPRAEKLRARGLLSPARPLAPTGEALRRAQVAQRRRALGTPLTDALANDVFSSSTARSRALLWAAGCAVLIGGLIWLVGNTALAVGVASVAFLIAWFAFTGPGHNHSAKPMEIASAQAFDTFLQTRGTKLPNTAVAILQGIRGDLAALLAALPLGRSVGVFNPDEASMVHSLIARYLPDAVDPYLALTAPSAEQQDLLSRQLNLMAQMIRKLRAKLEDDHARRLIRNAQFLERRFHN